MATMQAAVFGLLLASCMLSAQAIELGDPSEILDLDSLCTSQLNTLWLKYTNSSGVEGCDQACLSQCYTILQNALYATKNKDCPLQTDIQRCFHVFSDDWEDYVKECELFAWTNSESEGEGEGESSSSSEGEASPSSTDAESEAEASPSPSTEEEAEASPSPSEAESSPSPSEAESSPSPSEAEAEPSPSPSEVESESSPSPSEAESESSPSPSEAESESSPSPSSGRRRLLSEGESEGEGVAGGGCFPAFASPEDFEKYIDGEWEFEGASNGAGIGLSVAFFVGLVGLALFLKA